jgi:hypothetical protein
MMNTRNSRFQRGTGVYQCQACKRSTRATGGDNHQVGLCEECYEIAGLENAINDHGDPNGQHAKDIAALKQRCIAKGGKL